MAPYLKGMKAGWYAILRLKSGRVEGPLDCLRNFFVESKNEVEERLNKDLRIYRTRVTRRIPVVLV
jgi:hypothetical protein